MAASYMEIMSENTGITDLEKGKYHLRNVQFERVLPK